MIFDRRPCDLGEGPLWHPLRQQLFWLDITAGRMLSVEGDESQAWNFPFMISAVAWVDYDRLLVASEQGLVLFNLMTGATQNIAPVEADDPVTRSNDGRADLQGGFWFSTMGKMAEPGKGAIWRYYRGVVRKLFSGMTIPNAICFNPDGRTAHFTDTLTQQVLRLSLDADGWPKGIPELFLDLTAETSGPDGAVMDADGLLWLAQWGAGCVRAFSPDGAMVRETTFPAPHTSCPAFGGADLSTLFCTSALQDMSDAARAAHPAAGMTFAIFGAGQGRREPAVGITEPERFSLPSAL